MLKGLPYVACANFDLNDSASYKLENCTAGLELLKVVCDHLGKTKYMGFSLDVLEDALLKVTLYEFSVGGFLPSTPAPSVLREKFKVLVKGIHEIYLKKYLVEGDEKQTEQSRKARPFKVGENTEIALVFSMYRNAGTQFFGNAFNLFKSFFDKLDVNFPDKLYVGQLKKVVMAFAEMEDGHVYRSYMR